MRVSQRLRGRRRKVAATLSALALGATGIVGATTALSPQADAYTPITKDVAFGTPDGPDPTVTTKITLDDADGVVDPGQSIKYQITTTATAPQPGYTSSDGKDYIRAVYVVVTPDKNAPVTSADLLSPSDFTWSDGRTHQFLVGADGNTVAPSIDPATGAVTYSFGEPDIQSSFTTTNPLTVTFAQPATVSSSAPAGSTLTAKAEAVADINPLGSWTHTDPTYSTFDTQTCSVTGTTTHTFHGGNYGQWLAEIWVETNNNVIAPDPAGPTVTVTAPDGTDLTSQVFDGSQTLNPDDTNGSEITSLPLDGYSFRQSINFPFDKDTSTGEKWIPDGTTFTFTQKLFVSGCQPNDGTTWSTSYAWGIDVIAATNSREAVADDTVNFTVAGQTPKATFKVEKGLADGQGSAVELADGSDEFTVNYKVTVTNTSSVAGAFEDLTDNISDALPAGFAVKNAATPTATIPGEELAAGASKSYTVPVTFTVDRAAASANSDAGWNAVGTCDTTGGADGTGDKTKGLYNQVIMGADNASDGDLIANNDACVTVKTPVPSPAPSESPSPASSESPSPAPSESPSQPAVNPTVPSNRTEPSHPTVPVAPHEPTSPSHGLAHTGANVLGGGVVVGGLLALGWFLVSRRRRADEA